MDIKEVTQTCLYCPYWEKVWELHEEGYYGMCHKYGIPTLETEGCHFDTKWDKLHEVGSL